MSASPSGGDSPSKPPRACDRCRRRKIRCDRTSPCSGCRCVGATCTITDPAITRQKRKRVLLSSQYEEKLDLIDKRLSQVLGIGEPLDANRSCPTRSPAPSGHHSSSAASPNLAAPTRRESDGQPTPGLDGEDVDEMVAQGQCSLTAQSSLAIDFVHNAIRSCHQDTGGNSELGQLLDTLRQISNAFEHRRRSSRPPLPLAPTRGTVGQDPYEMPPLRAAVRVMQLAQGQWHIEFLALAWLLNPQSLSDLCLKVYFSPSYSDAEFIIVNAALYSLAVGTAPGEEKIEEREGHHKVVSMCQTNLETALSRLPLCLESSYAMVLALVLGATYAIEVSRPSLAWTLVSAAFQCARSLGFHIPPNRSGRPPEEPSQNTILFSVVYILERALCLRLGHSSIIPDTEIKGVWPDGLPKSTCHAVAYIYQLVKLAGLSGRIYELLYSAYALRLPGEVRTRRALELSQELYDYAIEAENVNQSWLHSMSSDSDREQIQFMSTCDEVQRLSISTLISRVMPPQLGSRTTFHKDCIAAARQALEAHQTAIRGFELAGSTSLLPSYVNWTILLTPFTPFIVLFCHAIETGDGEDLTRMHDFVRSLEQTCKHSDALARHHRLFQVFHGVAVRYTELKASPPPGSHGGAPQADIGSAVDAQLNALGMQAYLAQPIAPDPGQMGYPGGQGVVGASPGAGTGTSQMQTSGLFDPATQGLYLESWFSLNQQIMGLLDNNGGELPF